MSTAHANRRRGMLPDLEVGASPPHRVGQGCRPNILTEDRQRDVSDSVGQFYGAVHAHSRGAQVLGEPVGPVQMEPVLDLSPAGSTSASTMLLAAMSHTSEGHQVPLNQSVVRGRQPKEAGVRTAVPDQQTSSTATPLALLLGRFGLWRRYPPAYRTQLTTPATTLSPLSDVHAPAIFRDPPPHLTSSPH